MASKLMESRQAQKTYWERKLEARRRTLEAQGADAPRIERDPVVRGIKAKIRETSSRLRAIAAKQEKIKEMARMKEESKLAAQQAAKGKKKPAAEPAGTMKEKKAKADKPAKAAKEPKEPKEPKKAKEPKPSSPEKASDSASTLESEGSPRS